MSALYNETVNLSLHSSLMRTLWIQIVLFFSFEMNWKAKKKTNRRLWSHYKIKTDAQYVLDEKKTRIRYAR